MEIILTFIFAMIALTFLYKMLIDFLVDLYK
jgi:hypothetical protein